ncbi:VOC family protein [Sandaracinobacteroides saxicola]|uniref:VOC domain-containing protein n=1 Tax=Sandaracinobacteroides saxicola TaxID=2759707 RepID=A0A7G5IHH8_9SPHN|nr:VOC family protein [Sandaracinobacteroides saxicola]QMW22820.1 hypothetical protein H3309_16215 [Sandaracinobacteroides saxicola]
MQLSRPDLDIALFTADPAVLDFWRGAVGLAESGTMALTAGRTQHRLALWGGLCKVNLAPDGLPAAPRSPIRRLLIADAACTTREDMSDPDDNLVSRVPVGEAGVTRAGFEIAVRELAVVSGFLRDLGAVEDADGLLLGSTRIILTADPHATIDAPLEGPGWRYITIQVQSCDRAFAAALAAGGTAMMPPQTYADIARFAMLRDPGGTIWEVSQNRALVRHLEAG